MDENQIKEEYRKAKTGALVFFIISMCGFAASVALIIVAIVIASMYPESWYVYGYSAGLALTLGFTFLVLRSVFFTSKMRFLMSIDEAKANPNPQTIAREVDAKPVEAFKQEASRENKLYQQYENLHKQGYITDEELKQKRKELLGE